jgi:hypothetical protein
MGRCSRLIKTIEDLICSQDPETRDQALRQLGDYAVDQLKNLRSQDPFIRQQAWRRWRRFTTLNAIDLVLDAIDDDPAEQVRRSAQRVLDSILVLSATSEEYQNKTKTA